jgi:hypothetical protein
MAKPVLSVREKLDILEGGLGSTFWNWLVVPELRARLQADIDVVLSPKKPDASVDDNFQRGRIDMARWVLEHYDRLRSELRLEVANAVSPQPVDADFGSPYREQPGDVAVTGDTDA